MANSRFEYVKEFERENYLIPDTFVVVRVDGRSFHLLSRFYNFAKPNDARALEVMNAAAVGVFRSVQDILIAYGDSDEYSFVFDASTRLFDRREAKLVSTVLSTFTAHYITAWPAHFTMPLDKAHLPTFDARAVVYPTWRHLRDYISWRQADCHINNLYNTAFWALVERAGLTPAQSEERLRGTLSSDKNELLWQLGINYNNEPQIYRKGTIVIRSAPIRTPKAELTPRQEQRRSQQLQKAEIQTLHQDVIKDDTFWARLISDSAGEHVPG